MDNYKSKLEAFTTYPWQEDDEIDFVRLVKQYWDGPERNASSSFWRDYIRRLVKINPVIMKSQTTTDKFINDLHELIEADKGVFANRLSEALENTGLRFNTLREAQDFAANTHEYYFVCENCGNKMTCRCSQHKTKVMVGSCHNCDGSMNEESEGKRYACDVCGGTKETVKVSLPNGGTAWRHPTCKPRRMNEGTYSSDTFDGVAAGIDPRIKQQGEVAVKRLRLKTRGKDELQRPAIKRA